MNIESQNIIVKNTLPSKCFDFWFETSYIMLMDMVINNFYIINRI